MGEERRPVANVTAKPGLTKSAPKPDENSEVSQVRSGMGAYAGAARRRVHLVTVLLGPPSGHRPDRRQARHAHILQIGLRLAIAQADARPASFR